MIGYLFIVVLFDNDLVVCLIEKRFQLLVLSIFIVFFFKPKTTG